MWNPGDDKKTAGMMISAVVIVCLALIAVIFAFVMLQRRHESEISAASDTEGQTEITIEIGKAKKEEETAGEDGDEAEEDADHLAYTDSVRYTWEELSWLDSYGLCITRNEIYARHGRMFNDQDIQDYFNRQDWYVAQTSSADFDESVLNDVELYNVELIHSYELKQGY